MGVTPSVPVKANSGVRARVPAAGKVLEGDDKPILLREDQHYLHYITICVCTDVSAQSLRVLEYCRYDASYHVLRNENVFPFIRICYFDNENIRVGR